MNFSFHSAGSLVFGRDAVQQIGTIAAERLKAKKVFLVTDKTLLHAGLVATVVADRKSVV